jgi:hypothetical protein
MTNEEMQRAMEFIVEMEAKSSAKIGALAESQKRAQDRTDERITSLLAIAEIHEREINANTQHITSVSRDIAALSREIGALGETTKATDERLNTLINVVERQISNGRNGK